MPFAMVNNSLFTQFFHGWNRIEARSRCDDFSQGLEASTADPLWALARQWQLLELKGEDAGTPIQVELSYEKSSLNRIKLGTQSSFEIGSIPVEVLVEREAMEWDWRMRVRAGQHFERLLRLQTDMTETAASELIASIRIACPILKPSEETSIWADLDYSSRRFVSLMEGRAIDGKVLFDKIKDGNPPPGIPDELQRKFTDWCDTIYSQSPNRVSEAWDSEQLDYNFRLESTKGAKLHASSYRNGSIDWDAFALEKTPSKWTAQEPLQLTPTRAGFAGQPMRRWWEFEDYAVNLGTMDTAKTDLGKLILLEFALVFGDDWFVVPLEVSPNSLVRVRYLKVRDCFGQTTEIEPAREDENDPLKCWDVFGLGPELRGGKSGDFLFIPPVSGYREESPILEEVRFARDEDANTVFAIEHTVLNQIGESVSGFAANLEQLRRQREHGATESSVSPDDSSLETSESAEQQSEAPKIKYVLATEVPANWIPFIATDTRNLISGVPQRSVVLQRAAMVATENEDEQDEILGVSRLLKPNKENPVNWIREEAVGREGVRIELRRQRMRSPTGETLVWLGRKIAIGKGETRSGLQFDLVK